MNRAALWNLLLVGSGGFVGSALRFAISDLTHRFVPAAVFPAGTLVVNVVGCFALGLFCGLADARQLFGDQARLLLFVGVLGGFTTFSTFAYETFVLAQHAALARAAANTVAQVVLGLGGAWLGYTLARYL